MGVKRSDARNDFPRAAPRWGDKGIRHRHEALQASEGDN